MNVYGRLTIIDQKRLKRKVLCLCECGTEKWIDIFNIKKGDVLSCGCLKKERMVNEAKKRFTGVSPTNFTDYSGKEIGVVKVLNRIRHEDEETWYLLKCACGTEFETRISTLRRTLYKKCRCGFIKHPLKNKLQQMINRCEVEKNESFKWYGGKGIRVCEEWKLFPIKFIEWALKNGWKKGLTIDRIDSSKGYEPENCKWISHSKNCRKAAKERWARKNLV